MKTYEEMKEYIKRNGYAHLVAELTDGTEESTKAAVEYVYDGHTMSREDFRKKWFGF
jgi:hypothetical protein